MRKTWAVALRVRPDPITDPANPNNNVVKNFPTVNAFEQANLSKTCSPLTSSSASVAEGTQFQIHSDCIVTNNGPFGPVTFSDTTTLSLAPGCTTGNGDGFTTGTLAVGQSQEVVAGWVVTCTGPSFHTFSVTDHVILTGPIHVYDPCPNPPPGPVPGPHPACADDNSVTQTITVAITVVVDDSITKTCTAPATSPASTPFTVSCSGTIVLTGATSATWTATASAPATARNIHLQRPADGTITPVPGTAVSRGNGHWKSST